MIDLWYCESIFLELFNKVRFNAKSINIKYATQFTNYIRFFYYKIIIKIDKIKKVVMHLSVIRYATIYTYNSVESTALII